MERAGPASVERCCIFLQDAIGGFGYGFTSFLRDMTLRTASSLYILHLLNTAKQGLNVRYCGVYIERTPLAPNVVHSHEWP